MTVSYQAEIAEKGYNGWTNYETWNVALWIQNDQSFYATARQCDDYEEFVSALCKGCVQTPDGVKWNSPKVNLIEIADLFEEL